MEAMAGAELDVGVAEKEGKYGRASVCLGVEIGDISAVGKEKSIFQDARSISMT